MDTNTLLIIIGIAVGLCIAWLIGRWLDPYWRTKMLRNYTKKDYFLVYLMPKNRLTLRPVIINIEEGTIQHKNKMWSLTRGKIYNKEEPEKQTNIRNPQYVKWEQGVPVVFLDEDTLIPLNFETQFSEAKPSEIYSTLSQWHANQRLKTMGMGQQNLMLYVLIIGILTLGAVGFVGWDYIQFKEKIMTGQVGIDGVTNPTIIEGKPVSNSTGKVIYPI